MAEPPPTSVLLPTTAWTDACDEVADQLRPGDELLVICDSESDPVARRDAVPDGVRIVVAGDPEGCSGKANAIAAGMEAAAHDRIVWTDDDFHHPPDWLATLHAEYERHGPATELPFFVGRDPLSTLLEPMYVLSGTLGVYLADQAWGGSVVFERSDLDVAAFLADLRRTVSDDGLLGEYLDVTPVLRTRTVPVGGSIRESLERHVRWIKIVRYHDPPGFAVTSVVATLVAVAAVLFPLPAAVLLTLAYLGCNAVVGRRRWTPLLAYPMTLVQVPLLAYALARRTFVWGGRRYRWRGKFDVSVVE
ncbi:glycosyl transferase [Halobacteriales archaeon QS_1_68_20]|nr:MAG: glycosyl transferase [Halobacteriales archaeon QS_1_68_20]